MDQRTRTRILCSQLQRRRCSSIIVVHIKNLLSRFAEVSYRQETSANLVYSKHFWMDAIARTVLSSAKVDKQFPGRKTPKTTTPLPNFEALSTSLPGWCPASSADICRSHLISLFRLSGGLYQPSIVTKPQELGCCDGVVLCIKTSFW